MKRVFWALGAGLAIAAAAGAPAIAQEAAQGTAQEMRTALTGEEMRAMLQAAGLPAEMRADGASGNPVVMARSGSVTFLARGLDCSGAPAACVKYVFLANFNLGRTPTQDDWRTINSFNDTEVFGRAYVLENAGQVGVDFVLSLDGGVSEAHLASGVAQWTKVVDAFVSKFAGGDS